MNTELADRSGMNIADIISFAENAPLEELEEIIAPQIRCNKAISEEGLENPYGAEVGRVLMKAGNGCSGSWFGCEDEWLQHACHHQQRKR